MNLGNLYTIHVAKIGGTIDFSPTFKVIADRCFPCVSRIV